MHTCPTGTHVIIHVLTHLIIQAHTSVHVCMQRHAHMCAHMSTYMCVVTYLVTWTYAHRHAHTSVHTCVHIHELRQPYTFRQTHTPTLRLHTNTSTAVCTQMYALQPLPVLSAQAWGSSASVLAQRPTSVGFLGFPSTAGLGQSPWGLGGGRAAPQTEGQLGFVLREGPLDLPLTSPGWRLAGAVSPHGLRLLQGRAVPGNPNHPIHSSRKPSLLLLCSLHSACQRHAPPEDGEEGGQGSNLESRRRLARGTAGMIRRTPPEPRQAHRTCSQAAPPRSGPGMSRKPRQLKEVSFILRVYSLLSAKMSFVGTLCSSVIEHTQHLGSGPGFCSQNNNRSFAL